MAAEMNLSRQKGAFRVEREEKEKITTVPMMHGGLTTFSMTPREGGVGKKDCMSRNALRGRVAELEPEDGF